MTETWSTSRISLESTRDFLRVGNGMMLAQTPFENNATIAPWLTPDDDPSPPSPPQKHQPSFAVPHKPSFASFGITSATNLLAPRPGRPSEAHSIAESSTSNHSDPLQMHPELRKSKSSMFSHLLKKSRSKPRLRADSEHLGGGLVDHQATPSYASGIVPFFPSAGPPSPTTPNRKGGKFRTRKKLSSIPPPVPPKDNLPIEPELLLDTNLDQMDGIIDLTVLPPLPQEASSPSSGFESHQSSGLSHSDCGINPPHPSPPNNCPIFSNPHPFFSSPTWRPHYATHHRKISPKTILPSAFMPPQTPDSQPSWTPPESWWVEKEGEDADEPDYSSSEGSVLGRPLSVAPGTHKRKSRRKTVIKPSKPPPGYQSYKIRIYRANTSHHVASIGLTVTVSELTPVLNQKLLSDGERETHKLYLKERGRERLLAQTEKPADIVRRRLEQCGYDTADGLEVLGAEDLSFLLKFVFKSQLLGPADEDISFLNFEHIDLQGRSLRTVPVVLHANADCIISLNLSRNPILEIPLDFIQSCTTLRELRLSNMAMKKVPQSVRHSITLRRLDLSCNRIVDLDEAGLDGIPELTTLRLQNNRMEKLPWYFPRLRSLKHLNISNNKFRKLPSVVAEMVNLVDLDISFNMISELPEQIGRLKSLETFIIVGNQVTKFPDECSGLVNLQVLDCRRNHITDLAVVCMLPKLEKICADHNAVHVLDLSLGPNLTTLDASRNDITHLSLVARPVGPSLYALTSLDISHAKLSSLDDLALAQLSSLQSLKLDYNSFRFIPESLGELGHLVHLSCSDNQLGALPASIGRLQNLQFLDVHNNSLSELPQSVWSCGSLAHINVTSNLLGTWHDPPVSQASTFAVDSASSGRPLTAERKTSAGSSSGTGRPLPPLAHSLERLYLGENRVTDDVLHPLMIFKELRVLNLSFNDIQDMPHMFFKNLTKLEELYLSGNKLSSFPTEDLHRLKKLSVLFLNGNRLKTLPHELGKVQSLTVLDVGSNVLKYNINNVEFDWNWNFNKNLKYLNLSGNKRLEIKSDHKSGNASHEPPTEQRNPNADFSSLTQLRVLGLMDVTTTFTANIPDENVDRRVRTSVSVVNKMAYGIADNLGKNEHLNMLDLVKPEFRDRKEEAIFAMFGRTRQFGSNNALSKYLHDHFLSVFAIHLGALDPSKNEGVKDALRRSFLKLNKVLYDELYSISCKHRKMSQTSTTTAGTLLDSDMSSLRSGASGIVLYLADKTLYVANAGNALAVVSRQGSAEPVSTKHDPFDRRETARIRAAEGWVSPKGLVNDEIDVSRSFGFYHLLPVVNARPDICTWPLTALDEFVIVGNHGLWDYVSYQTAVDIARSEADPMLAAQKLRDFAISYGAEGSTMIMVIRVSDLFDSRAHQPATNYVVDPDPDTYSSLTKIRRRKDDIGDRNISRLDGEVSPPTGHLALVFTDIRNSTHLWEANAGMPTAMRLHNNLLRRQLRFCGGYEVKTEGDAFMCSFPTALSALWWCLTVQVQLLNEEWPLEILECEDGRDIVDSRGLLVARGLSVRMGIHCGTPLCEPDPITHRMDYFGSVVNRSARITGSAGGGQIMCSADVVREINARILETESWTEYSDLQPLQAVEAIRRTGVSVFPVGEVKLKGLEVPEMLSLVYPTDLEGRQELDEPGAEPSANGSRIQFSIEQIQSLAYLCLRLEALSSSRIFRSRTERKKSMQKLSVENQTEDVEPERSLPDSAYMDSDPSLLIPSLSDRATDAELITILDSLSMRIENALASLYMKLFPHRDGIHAAISALQNHGGFDEQTLKQMLCILQGL